MPLRAKYPILASGLVDPPPTPRTQCPHVTSVAPVWEAVLVGSPPPPHQTVLDLHDIVRLTNGMLGRQDATRITLTCRLRIPNNDIVITPETAGGTVRSPHQVLSAVKNKNKRARVYHTTFYTNAYHHIDPGHAVHTP